MATLVGYDDDGKRVTVRAAGSNTSTKLAERMQNATQPRLDAFGNRITTQWIRRHKIVIRGG